MISRGRNGSPVPTVSSPTCAAAAAFSKRSARVWAQDRARSTETRSVRATSRARSAASRSGSGLANRPRRPASTITSCPVSSNDLSAAASGSHNATRLRAWVCEATAGTSDALHPGRGMLDAASASSRSPPCRAWARSITDPAGATSPRR